MTKNTVKNHFDAIAPFYDNFKKRNKIYYDTLKLAIRTEIQGKKVSILDIGCGTGNILEFLKPIKGIGIDVSSQMVQEAEKKYGKNKSFSFFVHNIEQSPYKENVSHILFNDVIEHVQDKKKAIQNITLSMNTHTTLILSMANPMWEPLLVLLEKLGLKMPEGEHERISEKDLFDLLKKNNLIIKSKKTYLPHFSFPLIKHLGLLYIYVIKKN